MEVRHYVMFATCAVLLLIIGFVVIPLYIDTLETEKQIVNDILNSSDCDKLSMIQIYVSHSRHVEKIQDAVNTRMMELKCEDKAVT